MDGMGLVEPRRNIDCWFFIRVGVLRAMTMGDTGLLVMIVL